VRARGQFLFVLLGAKLALVVGRLRHTLGACHYCTRLPRLALLALTESTNDFAPSGSNPLIAIDRRITGRGRAAYFERKLEEALYESDMRVSLVAEHDGRAVGFIMVRVDFGEFGRIEPTAVMDTIGVDPDYRGQGIGRALMSQLLTNLTTLRVEHIRTDIDWRDGGEPSKRQGGERHARRTRRSLTSSSHPACVWPAAPQRRAGLTALSELRRFCVICASPWNVGSGRSPLGLSIPRFRSFGSLPHWTRSCALTDSFGRPSTMRRVWRRTSTEGRAAREVFLVNKLAEA
jgi:ribosomal protein S18 acetylase RimI-like enzyme